MARDHPGTVTIPEVCEKKSCNTSPLISSQLGGCVGYHANRQDRSYGPTWR